MSEKNEHTHRVTKNKGALKAILCITLILLVNGLVWYDWSSKVDSRLSIIESNLGSSPLPGIQAMKYNERLETRLDKETERLDTRHNNILQDFDAVNAQIASLEHSLDFTDKYFISEFANISSSEASATLDFTKDVYSLAQTKFGAFTFYILNSEIERNGVKIDLMVTNGTVFKFINANLKLNINGTEFSKTIDIVPSKNVVSVLAAPIKMEDIRQIDVVLVLDSIL